MDKADGQADWTVSSGGPSRDASSRPAATTTRHRLLRSAAELIAEVGWGRVTTRAVAERAGLPHGAVSYHFRGKQELLVEAALHAFAESLPADAFASLQSVDDLLFLIQAEIGDASDPVMSRLMLETMREAERDEVLSARLRVMLHQYRRLIVDVVRAGQQRGEIARAAPAEAIGTLLGATGDGLLLHALIDPDLDVSAAVEAMRALLGVRDTGRSSEKPDEL